MFSHSSVYSDWCFLPHSSLFSDLFRKSSQISARATRSLFNKNKLYSVHSSLSDSNRLQSSIRYHAVAVWNSLSQEIKNLPKHPFISKLKEIFFTIIYILKNLYKSSFADRSDCWSNIVLLLFYSFAILWNCLYRVAARLDDRWGPYIVHILLD